MHLQKKAAAKAAYEYGCDLRRLYPWQGVADPSWGAAIASVRPGEATSPHAHDESETFIFLSGRGRMRIGGESEEVAEGDVVFIPRNSHHQVANASDAQPLVFLTVYWDSPEARARLQGRLGAGREDL